LATHAKRSIEWVALFGALAVANIIQLFVGTGRVFTTLLVAVGFIGVAFAALYRPSGFLAVSWRQLRSPRKIGTANRIALVGVALIVAATVIQLVEAATPWFKT
jgi:hypothetical protein